MRANRLRHLLAVVALAAMTGVAASQALQPVRIQMSSGSIPGSTARIAKEMGFFAKHGIDATIGSMDSNNSATTALIARAADFATTAASDLVILAARGQDVVALHSSYAGFAAVIVISKAAAEKANVSPTAPVAERLKALDGLTIAVPSPTSTFTVATKSSAESAGAKINLVYMAQPAMVAALQAGAIQGFVASAPFYVQPARSGAGVIWIAGPKGEFPKQHSPANSTVVMTTRAYAVANPDLMRRVTAAFADFGKAAKERPGDMRAAIARLFPDVAPDTLDLLVATEAGGFAIGALTPDQIAHDIEFVKAAGMAISGLDKVKPADLIFAAGQ